MYPPVIQFESRRREIEAEMNRRLVRNAAGARRYRAHDGLRSFRRSVA